MGLSLTQTMMELETATGYPSLARFAKSINCFNCRKRVSAFGLNLDI